MCYVLLFGSPEIPNRFENVIYPIFQAIFFTVAAMLKVLAYTCTQSVTYQGYNNFKKKKKKIHLGPLTFQRLVSPSVV